MTGDAPHRARLFAPDLCLVALRLVGWASVTMLTAAGCLVLGFAMLGGFTFEGFFGHLDNIASRFATADAARRERFLDLVRVASALLVLALSMCRWRSLRACIDVRDPSNG